MRRTIPALLALALALGLAGAPSAQTVVPGAPSAGGGRQGPVGARKANPLAVGPALQFGGVPVGQVSATQAVQVQNTGAAPVVIDAITLGGASPGAFQLSGLPALPLALAPGQAVQVGVAFQPGAQGGHSASLRVDAPAFAQSPKSAVLAGVGLGAPGAELKINAGGFKTYQSAGAGTWVVDFGFHGGLAKHVVKPVAGTTDDILYRDQRQGLDFGWSLPLPDGPYAVTLRFAELELPVAGARVFDVLAEGAVVLDDLDVLASAGFATAHERTFEVLVEDGVLDLDFDALSGLAFASAIQVRGIAKLAADPPQVDFGAVASQSSAGAQVSLTNQGLVPLEIDTLSFLVGPAGTPAAMSATLAGQAYAGAVGGAVHAVDVAIPAGASIPLDVAFAPVTDQYDQCTLRLAGAFGALDLVLTGLGGHVGHPYLHPVIEEIAPPIDYDQDGVEEVVLDGSLSHTHEPGQSLVGYAWTELGAPLASGPVAVVSLAVGSHEIRLEITDDGVPPDSLATTSIVDVVPSTEVPGVLVSYHDASGSPATPASLMASPPATAEFVEVVPELTVGGATSIGTSPFAQDVMVRMRGAIEVPAGTYAFALSGGSQRMLVIDGQTVVAPIALAAGRHALDARFAVDAAGALPLEVEVSVGGGPMQPVPPAWIDHDESALEPFVASMPAVGTSLGGNAITITGLGFFPEDQVVVHWGDAQLAGAALQSVQPGAIELVSPPGNGTIQVTVATPNGTSNAVSFTYDPSGPVPITFTTKPDWQVTKPTCAVLGPDGRLYVGGLDGKITAIEFDADYAVLSKTVYAGVSGLSNHDLLGIAINPFDPPSPVRLYVSHGEHFVSGGSSFVGPSPYTGQISVLEGPGFAAPQPLITGLPTSNHDHAVNGIVFDNNGDLLISVGSNTNAGVKHPNSGDLVESPLSAALVKAYTSRPDFNGAIEYVLSASGLQSDDQVDGEIVDVAPGVDVEVYAPGLRNAYDLVLTTEGRIFATDNGPNTGFGAASTGPASEAPDPQDKDEILRVEHGVYYGSPNRGRGRYDARQNVYRNGSEPSIPGEFRQTMLLTTSSLDGIDEYRANTFQGQMRGDLIAQRLGSNAYRIQLSDDGRAVTKFSQLSTWTGALGLETLPGGAYCAIAQGLQYIRVFAPVDASAQGLKVHDVFPWRGPEGGGTPFVLSGVGFGTLANTQVFFDGVPAALTSVAPTRIKGVTPAVLDHDARLVDVKVRVGGGEAVLDAAFRFLYPPGNEPGTWEALPAAPQALGEVGAGVIGGVLHVVGSGAGATLRYSIPEKQWLANAAARPFVGAHHAVEVLNGKLYVVGGLGGSSAGKLQIFDPATGAWTVGPPLLWAGGGVATAVIGGKLHAAGGVAAGATVASHAVFDPALGTWAARAPMPVGRNHAAAGTDGERFFVIGGKGGGYAVANGADDVQVYDPATDAWTWSGDGVSGLAPLPAPRSGMGRAVFLQGELYVIGGETLDGAGANESGVFDRVDVYDPVENAWRTDRRMPAPRHGVQPVLFESRIFVACGGSAAGAGGSTVLDAFARP